MATLQSVRPVCFAVLPTFLDQPISVYVPASLNSAMCAAKTKNEFMTNSQIMLLPIEKGPNYFDFLMFTLTALPCNWIVPLPVSQPGHLKRLTKVWAVCQVETLTDEFAVLHRRPPPFAVRRRRRRRFWTRYLSSHSHHSLSRNRFRVLLRFRCVTHTMSGLPDDQTTFPQEIKFILRPRKCRM